MDEHMVIRRIDNYRNGRGDPPSMVLNQHYRHAEFTNIDLRYTDINRGASFTRPDNSGVIDFGSPWEYRFVVVRFTRDRKDGVYQRRKNTYMVKAGCKWLTREEAYTHWDLSEIRPGDVRKSQTVASWSREGVIDLLRIADIRANLYWKCGFKVSK